MQVCSPPLRSTIGPIIEQAVHDIAKAQYRCTHVLLGDYLCPWLRLNLHVCSSLIVKPTYYSGSDVVIHCHSVRVALGTNCVFGCLFQISSGELRSVWVVPEGISVLIRQHVFYLGYVLILYIMHVWYILFEHHTVHKTAKTAIAYSWLMHQSKRQTNCHVFLW